MKLIGYLLKLLAIILILGIGMSLVSCAPKAFGYKTEVVKPKKRLFQYNHSKHRYKKRTRKVTFNSH